MRGDPGLQRGMAMKLMVQARQLLLALVLGSAAVAGADTGSAWKSPGQLVEAFVELALKSDYSTRVHPVRKWTTPIRYMLVHRVGEEEVHAALVITHLGQIARITGLDIEPATAAGEANYVVVLTREDMLEADTLQFLGSARDGGRERFFRDSICLASFRANPKGSILRAAAMIPVDRARGKGDLLGCVAEELTHMLGLSNDTHLPLPTIFSHGTVRGALSGLDYLMLKMLYDPRVKPGMKEAALRPILHGIAIELERSGVIEAAERLAAETGLAGINP